MTLKVILLAIFSLHTFGLIQGQVSPWREPVVTLTPDALKRGIKYEKIDSLEFKLTIPENSWVGNDFQLGNFNYEGSKNLNHCFIWFWFFQKYLNCKSISTKLLTKDEKRVNKKIVKIVIILHCISCRFKPFFGSAI